MPELTSPWWLLGLVLVPLVRWLHRFRAGERLLRVPALFLWEQAGATASSGTRRGEPDPDWRRRALLVGLLVLALAGPEWNRQPPPAIQVWLDDGPSLFSREDHDRTRLDLAADALSLALEGIDFERVTLHALARPGEARGLPATDPESISEALRDWLAGPGDGLVPGALPAPSPGTRRWLVSDGVRPPHPVAFPFHRVIQVGRNRENLALVRLALRRSLEEPGQVLGLIAAINAGSSLAETTLELDLDGDVRERWSIGLAPGERIGREFALDGIASGTLLARLLPDGDALPADDRLSLTLDTAVLGLPLAVTGDCGPAVDAAIAAHPGILRGAVGDARLHLWCAAEPPPADGAPVLRLSGGKRGEPPQEPPVWEDTATKSPPALRPAWVRPFPAPAGSAGRPLLRAGDRTLIAEHEHPHRIDVLMDLNAPALASEPELPLLLDVLLGRLAGTETLFPTVATDRDPATASVAPRPLPAYRADFEPAGSPVSVAPILLAAALSLLLLDLYRGWRTEVVA